MKKGIIRELRVNQGIKAKEVLLIGETGGQLGLMPLFQALQIAKERNLDLVEVAPTATPPVCKLLDYGKYRYEQAKKERRVRKGQKARLLKEIRLRPRIKDHDLDAKIKIMRRLLEDGDKVKVSLIFRGREISHPERGWKILKKIAEDLKGTGMIDGSPVVDETNMSLTILPQHQHRESKVGKEG